MDWIESDWHKLYKARWGKLITKASYSHPAKYARGLIRHIYQHAVDEGWLEEGDVVLDPFGGVALGALDAMKHGLYWIGVELEKPFMLMGQENIERWLDKYGVMPKWGSAVLLHGDSRFLVDILSTAGVDCNVSSPPYAETPIVTYGKNPGGGIAGRNSEDVSNKEWVKSQGYSGAAASVGSPPYAETPVTPGNVGNKMMNEAWGKGGDLAAAHPVGYGATEGQLGNMQEGDIDMALASPPFRATSGGCKVTATEGPLADPALFRRHIAGNKASHGYGESEGQLANMDDGSFDAAIGSPTYAEARIGTDSRQEQIGHNVAYGDTDGQMGRMKDKGMGAAIASPPYEETCLSGGGGIANEMRQTYREEARNYGDADAQLGAQAGDDFWMAARGIVDQVYMVLRPGGHAIWIVKAYVKDKQVVDFPEQWRMLCEAAGFVTVHVHRAWQRDPKGIQYDLFGGVTQHSVEYKSFFRRQIEKKYPENRIDYEIVLCMEKPI